MQIPIAASFVVAKLVHGHSFSMTVVLHFWIGFLISSFNSNLRLCQTSLKYFAVVSKEHIKFNLLLGSTLIKMTNNEYIGYCYAYLANCSGYLLPVPGKFMVRVMMPNWCSSLADVIVIPQTYFPPFQIKVHHRSVREMMSRAGFHAKTKVNRFDVTNAKSSAGLKLFMS